MNKFVKYHEKVGIEMIQFTKKHGSAKALLDFLARHMKRNNSVMISNSAIAEILGMSLSTVNKNIRILKENKLLITVRTGNASIFHLNKAVLSCLREGDSMFFKLDTTIILSDKEARYQAIKISNREVLNDHEINGK
jgi:Fe2+ or Zn2+ uptake regulation protein